jgi:predicted nucleotidyltransferase
LQRRPEMQLLPVLRKGAAHDAVTEAGFRSASDLRGSLCRGDDLHGLVPDAAARIYADAVAQRGIVTQAALEPAILSRLRWLPAAEFARLPDASEGLEHRLARACAEGTSLEGICQMVKSKRYALSRIRRMVLCAALGVRKELADGIPPYVRVLAANATGQTLLRQWAKTLPIPILTKPASVRRLPAKAQALFALEAAATDLYVLGYQTEEHRRGGSEWRISPVML